MKNMRYGRNVWNLFLWIRSKLHRNPDSSYNPFWFSQSMLVYQKWQIKGTQDVGDVNGKKRTKMSLVVTTSLEIKGLEDLGKCPPIPDSDNYEKTVFLEGALIPWKACRKYAFWSSSHQKMKSHRFEVKCIH